jgi:hypothetical protein
MLNNGRGIANEIVRVLGLLTPIQKLAEAHGDDGLAKILSAWRADLEIVMSVDSAHRY